MSDDKDKKPPEEGEERTVFMPLPPAGGEPPGEPPAEGAAAATPAAPEVPAADAAPAETADAAPAPEPAAAPPAGDSSGTAAGTPATSAPGASPTAFAPRDGARPIKVGDVLNHIFEVKRFLARGGMGEVFEGCNVNTDERVAIKVMLPALAADEKVVAMFRKEARTLTKLQHEALVSYRVLAQEPQLGVLYIVTEFIEGVDLGGVLGNVERTPEELAGLLKRLASGLSAAHRLGAIHRDMSPDNVLLPGGDVHQAKIIDFGIAKDLDASSATIVGDGFAGKLNYVAPEQLGDFGREVGPWTDVYSLGLVMLAVAQGKNVNMSGSLVDAIDKRRKGPDSSAVPDGLRPLIEAMLRPDPKERLRSMDDVLAMLGGTAVPSAPAAAAAPASVPSRGGPPKALIVGAVLAAVLAVGAGSWYILSRGGGGLVPVENNISGNVSANAIPPVGDPVAAARNAINSVLPSVSCTWLDVGRIGSSGGVVSVAMRGVAGDSSAAQQELSRALSSAGLPNARLDLGDVAPILPAGCAALDTYRQVRASSDYHLSVAQPRFEMVMQPPGLPYAGEVAANAVIDLNLSNSASDFAIAGIEPSGTITALIPGRTNFEAAAAQSVDGRPIADLGNGRYRLNIDLDHQGWSGLILVSGQGPFVQDLIAPPIGSRGPSWQQQFLAAASQGNWRVEMVWFESVNRDPNEAPAGIPESAPPAEGDKEP